MSLLRAVELYGDHAVSSSSTRTTNQASFGSDANRKYREAVRQLPSQACMEPLVQTFFSEINWQYDLIDEKSFKDQLVAWRGISYSDLQADVGSLALETFVFPALLFQVLAHALLFHPPDDQTISSLITMAGMTFHDLGGEYSDTGADLLARLEKKNITLSAVQAGLLRASFLKSSGKVIEAWHTIGAVIRDAQDIGLHTGRAVSDRSPVETKCKGEGVNLVGHRAWVVLHIWDVHMAVVLGRPIATDFQIDHFARTIGDEETRQNLFSHWQSETDPPRPFDIILAGYNVAYRYFKDIHQLENNGANSKDYSVVENISAAIKENLELLPSWCHLEHPDTKFDQLLGCQWLPVARDGLSSLIHFVILALHRPFIFSVANSRTEALKAGISILRAQERLFEQLEPRQRKVFNFVYASFDAIVLITALCFSFPEENHGQKAECIEIIEKGIKRLGIIGESNIMARSAHGVVCSLYLRLRHRLGIFEATQDATATFTNPIGIPSSNEKVSEFSFDAVLPPCPTHDLFFDHLSTTPLPFTDTLQTSVLDPFTANAADGLVFEGDFSDNSFWSLMNGLGH
ncbi:transcriptional regulator family: Fungal Specific TF [Penicillium waksmanii]|uniref:transcriptional regulator family: Fungal Specific TF n=1 Tax=Penicillium waksmanii TaxID=69791 RepID=UPI002546F5DC|nr:transcriptional regulator family: Fungal Specific TF [Penicillium waksmanii]KAJ5988173.1 transcriptional regulator family: Fungal Specific TF [Penicillium waksmanii]